MRRGLSQEDVTRKRRFQALINRVFEMQTSDVYTLKEE